MTTTLTNSENSFSKMSTLTGIESLNFKMVSILFIILFSISGISAQTNSASGRKTIALYPVIHHQEKTKTATVPAAPKFYTIHQVKSFPILQPSPVLGFTAKDDSETFNYETMFAAVNKTVPYTDFEITCLALAKK